MLRKVQHFSRVMQMAMYREGGQCPRLRELLTLPMGPGYGCIFLEGSITRSGMSYEISMPISQD